MFESPFSLLPNEILNIILIYLLNQTSFEIYYKTNTNMMQFMKGKRFLPIKCWSNFRLINKKCKSIADASYILKNFDIVSFSFAKTKYEKIVYYIRMGTAPQFGAKGPFQLASKLEEYQLNEGCDFDLDRIFCLKINQLDTKEQVLMEKIVKKRKTIENWENKLKKNKDDLRSLNEEFKFIKKYQFPK